MQNKNYAEITSFVAACEAKKLDSVALMEKWISQGETVREIAGKQLEIFIDAINGKWKADISDPSQKKWYAILWFEKKKGKAAGFGLSDTVANWTHTYTLAGCRLFTETQEQIIHAVKYGEQMLIEYHCL